MEPVIPIPKVHSAQCKYSQIGKAVSSRSVEPEKRVPGSWVPVLITRCCRPKPDYFLINFSNQYDANHVTNSVTALGKTRHTGLETKLCYDLGAPSPSLENFSVTTSYVYVNAVIREQINYHGNQVTFLSKHKGTIGIDYRTGGWTLNLNGEYQSAQLANNANTVEASADGRAGRISDFMLWGVRANYDFCPQHANLNLVVGVKNIFDHEYFTRSFDDKNKGIYVGQTRLVYLQGSLKF